MVESHLKCGNLILWCCNTLVEASHRSLFYLYNQKRFFVYYKFLKCHCITVENTNNNKVPAYV